MFFGAKVSVVEVNGDRGQCCTSYAVLRCCHGNKVAVNQIKTWG